MRPSTLGKLITGIWEQIFSSISFNMSAVIDEWRDAQADGSAVDAVGNVTDTAASTASAMTLSSAVQSSNRPFTQMNVLCRKISQASRVSRALEVVVQARWVEHFDAQVNRLLSEKAHVSPTRARMIVLAEACRDFCWTEKELRNKM